MVIGIDHVQLAAPAGCESAARIFFGELLGLEEIPKPPDLAARGGLWFRCGPQQLHIGVDNDFRPGKKAHIALRLADPAALDQLADRLSEGGVEVRRDDKVEGVVRFFAADPWGNRLEFMALLFS